MVNISEELVFTSIEPSGPGTGSLSVQDEFYQIYLQVMVDLLLLLAELPRVVLLCALLLLALHLAPGS